MITTVESRKRFITVTDGNIRNSHISIGGLYDFFPRDCFGGPTRHLGNGGRAIQIELDGMSKTIETDIGRESKTGKPRRHFRRRAWVSGFYRYHGVRAGDILELERLEDRLYRLRLVPKLCETPIRVAEFFAGIGLVRLAMERKGLKIVFANDIDPEKFEMYSANFSTDEFRLGDIHQLRAGEIPDCEVATASFPCTDLSIAGEMNGINSGESSAFWGFVRLLRDMGERRPPVVLLENVPGFLMSHNGRDFESAMLALNDLGYAVDAFFLDAARFVPQSRLRLFVVGKQAAQGTSTFALEESATRPPALTGFIAGHPDICWEVRKLGTPPVRTVKLPSIIEDLTEDDAAWWDRDRAGYFMNQLSERHAALAQKMLASRSVSYATAFRRVRKGRSMAELRYDGLAGCLRTPKGGSGRQILFKAGKGRWQVRLMTARECARLQGVPDSYRINVPLNQALFGFGDAVCVPAVEWITENYLIPAVAAAGQQHV